MIAHHYTHVSEDFHPNLLEKFKTVKFKDDVHHCVRLRFGQVRNCLNRFGEV